VKVMLKLMFITCGIKISETRCSSFFPLCCFLCALLLTVGFLLCIKLLCYVFLLHYVYYFTMCVLLPYILSLPDCWLEVSIRKILRLATSAQVFLGFLLSKIECCDGSQDSKLLLMLLM